MWEGTKSALVLTTDELTGIERTTYPRNEQSVEHIHQVISPVTSLPQGIAAELDALSERIFTTIHRVADQHDPNANSSPNGHSEMILNELKISIEPTGAGNMSVQARFITTTHGNPEQLTGTHPMGEVLNLPASAFVHPNTGVEYSVYPNRLSQDNVPVVLAEPVWEPLLKEWEGRAIDTLQNLLFAAEIAASFTDTDMVPTRYIEQ